MIHFCASKVVKSSIKILMTLKNYFSDSDPKRYVNLRPNDVVIASYPRSGGNFVSEILYNIVVSKLRCLAYINMAWVLFL